ncbi:glycerophosphodiester phosphodiesterase [Candidatus Latescibacterota bacterium]
MISENTSLPIHNLSGRKPSPIIIAHRGASYLAPENTLSSVNLAWELGADAVEVDVRLTKDKKIILLHDETTKRTAGFELPVGETPYDELMKIDIGSFIFPEYEGEKIPLLNEVIETIPKGRRLFVEIKSGPEIIPVLKKLIDFSGKRYHISLMGFECETVVRCKAAMPEIPAYLLCRTARQVDTAKYISYDSHIINNVMKSKLDGVNVEYHGITSEFVNEVMASGLEIFVWTVNDVKEAKRLRDLDVKGITTDRPGCIKNNLK